MSIQEELKKLEKVKNKLPRKNEELIVADFDDTIFSTHEVLSKDARKGRRGAEGNEYIVNVIGIDNFINEYYVGKDYPKDISSKLIEGRDLILTAGIEENQIKKAIECGLSHINMTVVDTASEKILALIKYVIFDLKYIPSKITIYEDRPDFFIGNEKIIVEFLGIKLIIYFVEMEKNNGYKSIKKIEE